MLGYFSRLVRPTRRAVWPGIFPHRRGCSSWLLPIFNPDYLRVSGLRTIPSFEIMVHVLVTSESWSSVRSCSPSSGS